MFKNKIFFITLLLVFSPQTTWAQEKVKIPLEDKILHSSTAYLQKVATILVLLINQPQESSETITQAEKDEDSPEKIILRAKSEENESVRPIEKKESLIHAHRQILKYIRNNEKTLFNVNTLYKKIVKKLKQEARLSSKPWDTFLFGNNKDQRLPSNLTISPLRK